MLKDKMKDLKRYEDTISMIMIIICIILIASIPLKIFFVLSHSEKMIISIIQFCLLGSMTVGIAIIRFKNKNKYSYIESNAHDQEKHTFEPVSDQIKNLIQIIENIEQNEPFKNTLEFIFNSFYKYIPYTHIGVALIVDNKNYIRASYAVSGPQHKNLKKRIIGYTEKISNTSLGKIIKSYEPRVINDLEGYLSGKKINEYNRILLDEGIRSSITFPLVNRGIVVGLIFFSSNKKNVYRQEHVEFLKILANSIALCIEKNILTDDMVLSSTLALASLAEERDNETGSHIERMKYYTRFIAETLHKDGKYTDVIDVDYLNAIERFSQLHDIGKVAIPDIILKKPGKLTPKEFDIMKKHTIYGAKVLKTADENLKNNGISIFNMGIDIAEEHHEWWNGNGYPHGKKYEQIPLCARIVAVADVFDALTSKRVYKDAYSFQKSIGILLDESGSHFEPAIIDTLIKNINEFEKYYEKVSKLN